MEHSIKMNWTKLRKNNRMPHGSPDNTEFFAEDSKEMYQEL